MEHSGEVQLFLLEFWGDSVEIKLMSEGPKKKFPFDEVFLVLRLKCHTTSITNIVGNSSKELNIFKVSV